MSLLKKFEKENSTPRFFRRKIVISLCFMLLIGVIVEIYSANRLSTYGEQINKIYQAKKDLELENQVLENQIAKMSSLTSVGQSAASLGFGKIASVQYLQDDSLALSR